MEAMSPIAMWVEELARTPEKFAVLKDEMGSIEKPKKIAVVRKVDVDVAVGVDVDVALKLKLEAEINVALNREVALYREKMKEMEGQLEMMEKLVEDNELRFRQTLGAERERRRELEVALDASNYGQVPYEDALKVRELALREKEFELAEKKYVARKGVDDGNEDAFECCLSISDPSGDVLCDLSRLRLLEEALKSEKSSITTVAGLLDNALLRNDSLRLILESVGKYSVRFVLQRFKTKFMSLFKISKTSLSLVSILVMGRINPVKSRAAVKYASCRFKRELLREIPTVSKSGSVPVLGSAFKLMVLTDLPGITELLSTTDATDIESHWKALEEFVLGSVGHIKDVKSKLASAQKELDSFSGSQMTDVDEMLAVFNELFDVCTSWLGVEVEGDYKRIQRFVQKCPRSVQMEYADLIARDHVARDELTMEWSEFEGIIQSAWQSSSVKENIRAGFDLEDEQWKVAGQETKRKHLPARPAAAAANESATPVLMAGTNSENYKEISCKDCKKPFFPSLKQVDRLEKENSPLPDTCPKCKGQVCDNFSKNGECAYGDSCKFLHPAEFEKVANPSRSAGRFSGLGETRCRFATSGRCMKGENCNFSHEHAKDPASLAIVPFSRNNETVHMAAVASDVWTRFDDMPFEQCYEE